MNGRIHRSLPLVLLLFPVLLSCTDIKGQSLSDAVQNELIVYQDSQLLYNGKIWRREYSNIMGDEFLFSALWLKGNVVIDGKIFMNRMFRYDIANDELLVRRSDRAVVVLNSELTQKFDLTFEGRLYHFENFPDNSNNDLRGYACVLQDGKCRLILKYNKEVSPLGYQKVYDIFIQTQQLYLVKDNSIARLRGRNGLLEFLDDKADELKRYIRINKIVVMPGQPETVIPLIAYYNSLFE